MFGIFTSVMTKSKPVCWLDAMSQSHVAIFCRGDIEPCRNQRTFNHLAHGCRVVNNQDIVHRQISVIWLLTNIGIAVSPFAVRTVSHSIYSSTRGSIFQANYSFVAYLSKKIADCGHLLNKTLQSQRHRGTIRAKGCGGHTLVVTRTHLLVCTPFPTPYFSFYFVVSV